MNTDSPSVWRPARGAWHRKTAAAVALSAAVGAGPAAAQTVVMKGVTPEATLEAVLGQATATSKAGADGIARATLNALDAAPTAELVAVVYVDSCDANYRVVIVERTSEPPAANPGCTRREIAGAFVVRRITSLNIDVTGTAPALLIRQGPTPESWFAGPRAPGVERFQPPTGLIVFGGGGLARIRDAVSLFCGDLANCSGKTTRPALTGGVTFWFSPYVGAIASYTKPAEITASGSGSRFRFDSDLDAEVLAVSGAVGVPVRRVRLFGHVGMNYHRARFTTNQTTDPTTVTVDGEDVVLPGGTQTFDFETTGWGWIWGGGAEIWVTAPLAIYTELSFAGLKGDDRSGGEVNIDDTATMFMVGVRFRLGRFGR
jgi:opacity protein-like surface antigen